jgi:hypothetical protein
MFDSDAGSRRLPPTGRAVVALSLAAMLSIVVIGLCRSEVLVPWPDRLMSQAMVLLAIAGCLTLLGVFAPVRSLRGLPAVILGTGLATVILCGLAPMVAVFAISAASVVVGQILVAVCDKDARLDIATVGAVGLAAITLVLTPVGILHLPMVVAFWGILAAAAAATALSPTLRTQLAERFRGAPDTAAPWTAPRIACAWLIVFAWLFYAANAAVPERLWDALAMHLMIATQIVTFGSWGYDPSQFAFAFFPLGADHLFAFAMALGGERAPQLLNLCLLAASLVLLRGAIRSFASAVWAELGVLLLLSLPVTLLCTTASMVENVMVLFTLALLRLIMQLRETRVQTAHLVGLCLLGGALCTVKLHGAVLAAPAAIITLTQVRYRELSRRSVGLISVAIIFAALFGIGQYAYAYYCTRNPLFPIMNEIFKSPLWPPVSFEDPRWQGNLTWDLLYRMTFDSSKFMESNNGALGFVVVGLLLPGLLAIAIRPRRAPVIAVILSFAYLTVVLLQIQYIRYMYQVLPLLVIVGVYGLSSLSGGVLGWIAAACGAALAVLGVGVWPSGSWFLPQTDLRAAYDRTIRHALVVEQTPTRLATEAINSVSTGAPRVLYGGEPYGAMLRGHPIYLFWYNRVLSEGIAAAADPKVVAGVLDEERPDFVVASPVSPNPSERKVAAYAEMRGSRIADIGPVRVWRINPR